MVSFEECAEMNIAVTEFWDDHVFWQGGTSAYLHSAVLMLKVEDYSDNNLLMRQQFLLKMSVHFHQTALRHMSKYCNLQQSEYLSVRTFY